MTSTSRAKSKRRIWPFVLVALGAAADVLHLGHGPQHAVLQLGILGLEAFHQGQNVEIGLCRRCGVGVFARERFSVGGRLAAGDFRIVFGIIHVAHNAGTLSIKRRKSRIAWKYPTISDEIQD
jgi:hypothetical protein